MSNPEWQQTVDAMADAVFVVDRTGRVTVSNRAAASLFGSASGPPTGRLFAEVLYGRREAPTGCPIERSRRSHQRARGSVFLDSRRVELTAHPMLGAQAAFAGVVVVAVELPPERGEFPFDDQLFRDLFESANVGQTVTLPSGHVQVNEALARMLGYPREELIGRSWRELTHPEDVASGERTLATLLAGEHDEARLQKRYLRRDGATVWADVSTVLRRTPDGQPSYFITTIIDITAQKDAAERHRQAEERFTGVFFASPAGMTITRIADGRFVDANDAFLRMVECTREELIDRTSIDLGLWSAAQRNELIRRQMDTGGLRDCELQVRSRSGRLIDVVFSSRPVLLHGVAHHVTTLIDVTARKEAERQLAASEQRYRALFENMNAGFVLFEVVTDARDEPVDLIVRAANEGFESTTGLVADAVVGQPLTQVLPGIESDLADWIGTYGRVALTGQPASFESASEHLGRHYSVNAYRAGPRLCAVTFLDISERVAMRTDRELMAQRLRQSQRLESVGRLAGGIAHDFNNMLCVILGYGEALLDRATDDRLRRDVTEILMAARRSADLIRQLLAFSRTQTLRPEVLDLNVVVADMDRMLRPIIGEDIRLLVVASPSAGRVQVDPGQLQQVLVNLVINARDAMSAGGRLTIAVGDVDLRDEDAVHAGVEPGRYTVLVVADDGVGMTPEVLDRVFEPFFTTKEQGKGSGLGLATAYGVVRQSGGNITACSEPGRGTTFTLYFPVTNASAGAKTAAPEGPPRRGMGQHILVVEDDQTVRRLIGSALPDLGYRVTLATDGAEALRLAADPAGAPPDLLLTDVVLPHLSGPELVARMRRAIPGLRHVYMSGYPDRSAAQSGAQTPLLPMLQKPFTISSLAALLADVLDVTWNR